MIDVLQAKILVVGDDQALCCALAAALDSCSWNPPPLIMKAPHAAAALDALCEQTADLVLQHLGRSQPDDLDLLKAVQARWPNLPVIVVCDADAPAEAAQALRDGAWDFLVKPVANVPLLAHLLQRAMERVYLLAEIREYREHLVREATRQTAELDAVKQALARKNVALQELAASMQAERQKLTDGVCRQTEEYLQPLLHALRRTLPKEQQELITQFEQGLQELASPWVSSLTRRCQVLTLKELRICRHIRRGLSTKEIANLESISTTTVSVHRRHIRRKLGIAHAKVNLASHIETMLAAESPTGVLCAAAP